MKISQSMLIAVSSVAGVVALTMTTHSAPANRRVLATELAAIQGGVVQVCVFPLVDGDAVHCSTCLPDGNNQYVRCDDGISYKFGPYTPGSQYRTVLDTTACGGQALTYWDSFCDIQDTSVSPKFCYRTHFKFNTTQSGYDYGLTCN
ncbi:MAG: hypothetical protein KF774_09165 [Planctomyces sp.]|nr:hypothetical protein [Planctomyces sp.]